MRITHKFRLCIRAESFAIAILLIYGARPAVLAAQTSGEDGEISVMGGGSFGMGAHPFIGLGDGFSFSKYGMALVEASYTPLEGHIIWPRTDIRTPRNSYLLDFGLNFHIRYPIGEHWAPYGLFGGGLLFNSYRAFTSSETALIGIDDFKGAFFTGGGVRYYVRPNWGIRSECKVTVSSRVFTRVSFGVFYTLPSNWP
jgi:hypothetical protein